MNTAPTYAGYVAIVGRPNVGKSTLLNCVLGHKVTITARKPQTTRHRILGIKTVQQWQTIYVDTPGIHHSKNERVLDRYMNRVVLHTLFAVDVIIFMVVGTRWRWEDEVVLQALTKVKVPVILAINKVDLVKEKKQLLAHIAALKEKYNFTAILPVAAQYGTNISSLETTVQKLLPPHPFLFPPQTITDRDDKFIIAEIIREKLVRLLGQELPYATTVLLEQLQTINGVRHIRATIYVERRGQKIIIIGQEGQLLKKIGTLARLELEHLYKQKVYLQLWVKVKTAWSDNEQLLRQLGYAD